jgi:hypothetical protein
MVRYSNQHSFLRDAKPKPRFNQRAKCGLSKSAIRQQHNSYGNMLLSQQRVSISPWKCQSFRPLQALQLSSPRRVLAAAKRPTKRQVILLFLRCLRRKSHQTLLSNMRLRQVPLRWRPPEFQNRKSRGVTDVLTTFKYDLGTLNEYARSSTYRSTTP